jgi:hypothetical protein
MARDSGTGFAYSRASRAAVDGTFFSFRSSRDLIRHATRIFRWRVSFD